MGGTTTGAARDALATSKHLGALPSTRGALTRGELSVAQAAAVADAAAADPAAERRLLALAGETNVHELREECRRTKANVDPDPGTTHHRIHAQRSLRTFTDAEGAWNLHARGTVDDGARFLAAHGPILDELFTQARRDGRREPHDAYAFDALVRMADRAASPDATTTTKQRTNPRFLMLIRVDHAALVRGQAEGDELCEITGLGPIPVRVARDLLGDSNVHLVLTRGRDVATTVHFGRGPNAAQRIALTWSQPKCSNMACSGTFTQIDHQIPYAETKHTVLRELDPLCTHCHDRKTYGGWALIHGSGRRAFVPPHDPRHPGNRNTPPP
jgi:hypothetical protein